MKKHDKRIYIFAKQKKYKVKTIKRKIATLKAFFSYLIYEDIIDFNPFLDLQFFCLYTNFEDWRTEVL